MMHTVSGRPIAAATTFTGGSLIHPANFSAVGCDTFNSYGEECLSIGCADAHACQQEGGFIKYMCWCLLFPYVVTTVTPCLYQLPPRPA